MPSKTPTRGFRPGAARAAKMDAWAKARGITSQSEALAALVDAGLGVNTSPTRSAPIVESAVRATPRPAIKPHEGKDGVYIGRPPEPAGVRLKKDVKRSKWALT